MHENPSSVAEILEKSSSIKMHENSSSGSRDFGKNPPISKCMKIRPVVAEILEKILQYQNA
jgi:hypothetical protein